MAITGNERFDLKRIREKQNIPDWMMKQCPISEEDLEYIYNDYRSYLPELEKIRIEILSTLNEGITGEVHSIRSRIKKPDHLIGKIIRGCYKNPAKYSMLTRENYRKLITDLIGIRIIILDKRDWREVHLDILRIFRNLPDHYARRSKDVLLNYDRFQDDIKGSRVPDCCYHAERPVAYITSSEDRELYQDDYLKLDNSKAHYRSIHYIIRYKEIYFEGQMRSLFEEGWLEFDHRMKYPNDQLNEKKQSYISMLSNLAIAADQLISFYQPEDFVTASDSMAKDPVLSPDHFDSGADLEDRMKKLF